MTDPAFAPDAPAFPPRRAVELDPEAQRYALVEPTPERPALDRIADALTRIADYFAVSFEPEPEPDERTGEPDPEPPIDEAPAWEPVKGGRAWLPDSLVKHGRAVLVDRLYLSEGELVAYVVDDAGDGFALNASHLEPPR